MNRRRVKELFDRALDEEPARRDAFLERTCGPTTRREVDRLLAAHARCDGFLRRPAADRVQAERLAPGARVGSYTVLGPLGAGGGGAVYLAEQKSPRRRVALKVFANAFGAPSVERRFREEAEILARLQHPGIATVFEAGVDDGVPYFALEHVEGARPLTRYAAEARLDVEARLRLFAEVCDAVHHGHQKGVIHRDLKPANVLVDRHGRPRVIDFGIARLAGGAEPSRELAGTLPYMSPEQCATDGDLDVRCDVYALGVILYEFLHGRLPAELDRVPFAEAVRRIRRGLAPRVDRPFRGDIEEILAKATAPDRDARYASAAALADDVRRHLAHHPVEARAGGVLYALGKFARRRKGTVAAAAAFAALLVTATVVAARFAFESERQRRAAEFQAYVANVAAASAALRVDDVAEARQRLDLTPRDLRQWEWRHFRGRLDASTRTFSFPGRRIYTGAAAATAPFAAAGTGTRLWAWNTDSGATVLDVAVGQPVTALAFHPDARQFAVAYRDGSAEFRRTSDGAIATRFATSLGPINALSYSPDGRLLAAAGQTGSVELRNAEDAALSRTWRAHDDRVIGLCFAPGGTRLATAGRDGIARIWDVDPSNPPVECRGHSGSVEAVAFDRTGSTLATCSRDETVRLWNAATGAPQARWHGHSGNIRSVVFAPDDSIVTASYDSTLRVWKRPVGEIACLRGHTAPIMRLARRGERLLSFSRDGTVKEWDPGRGDPVPALRGHGDAVTAIAFDGSGRRIASAARDGSVVLWDASRAVPCWERDAGDHPSAVHFPGDGTLWTFTYGGQLRVWNVADGTLVREAGGQPRFVAAAGGRLVGAGRALLRHAADGWHPLAEFVPPIDAIALDARGRRVAVGLRTGEVWLCDAATGQTIARAQVHERSIASIRFHPAEALLATGSQDGFVTLLAVPSLAIRARFEGLSDLVTDVAFSPDGKRLASCGSDRVVRLWDVARAQPVATLTGHRNQVACLAWSPDGSTLASAEGSIEVPGIIRLWRD